MTAKPEVTEFWTSINAAISTAASEDTVIDLIEAAPLDALKQPKGTTGTYLSELMAHMAYYRAVLTITARGGYVRDETYDLAVKTIESFSKPRTHHQSENAAQ